MQYLPCPFCGSLNQEIYDLYYDGQHTLMYCNDCGAQAGEAENEEGAIALWNRRSALEEASISHQYLSCPFCGGREQEEYVQGKDFWRLVFMRRTGKSWDRQRRSDYRLEHPHQRSNTEENLMKKIIATTLLLPWLTFASPGLAQVTIDFQSQPTQQQLLQVVESATKDKNYSTALRVANNAIKQFPDLAIAYYYRAIALNNLGSKKDARLDFQHAKKLYVTQLKNAKISAPEKNEVRVKLETIERQLKLPQS